MGNISDYVKWRGDLTMSVDPFNEVDNLLMSYLSYVNIDGIAPVPGEDPISLKELSDRFFAKYSEEELAKDKSFIRLAPYLMKDMTETSRFGDLKVRNFINHICMEENLQVSAVEILLPDETSYIAYRGTDDRIVGWKEDFFIASGAITAQAEAVKYLNMVGAMSENRLRVGGHSKGGHLAVYASAFCDSKIQNRIIRIYNNDGPGFREDFLNSLELMKIRTRIQRIIPEGSIVGMLLGHTIEPEIIKSDAIGVLQHDGLSWQVTGKTFDRAECLTKSAEAFNETMDVWIDRFDDEERIAFIDDFFSVLEAPGVETLTELQNGGLKAVTAMLRRMDALAPETKEKIDLLLRGMLARWTDFMPQLWKERRESLIPH